MCIRFCSHCIYFLTHFKHKWSFTIIDIMQFLEEETLRLWQFFVVILFILDSIYIPSFKKLLRILI